MVAGMRRCSCCGENSRVDYTSLLHGNMCNNCRVNWQKVLMGNQKDGLHDRVAEFAVRLDVLNRVQLALKEVQKKYVLNPCVAIDFDTCWKQCRIFYPTKYRNKNAVAFVVFGKEDSVHTGYVYYGIAKGNVSHIESVYSCWAIFKSGEISKREVNEFLTFESRLYRFLGTRYKGKKLPDLSKILTSHEREAVECVAGLYDGIMKDVWAAATIYNVTPTVMSNRITNGLKKIRDCIDTQEGK